MTPEIIIIGGGVAGLSAAVDLCSMGRKILLLEQKPHLGGRTYSFVDKTTGEPVDNGQHLLMGCYKETRRYLDIIGSSHLARLQRNLRIDFLHPRNGFAALQCPPLPAPFNVLVGLMRLSTLPVLHRLRLLRMGIELISSSIQKERELAGLTVDEWLSKAGQTAENRKYLWDIIAVGTLNDDPKTVSALLFYRVLKAAFLGSRTNSSMLVPRVGLSELLVDPARRYVEDHGGEIRIGYGVDRLEIGGNEVHTVIAQGKKIPASIVISSVPYHALPPLFPGRPDKDSFLSTLSEFDSSPIITLHLWLDRKLIDQEFVALLDCRIQWIFNKTRILRGENDTKRQYLSLVISGAGELVEWSKERLLDLAMKELRETIPAARGAKIVHSLVIKEKRATFSPRPHVERLRPGARTPLRNFFLAGDWTDTGYPATIEGAILSGRRAAEEADKA